MEYLSHIATFIAGLGAGWTLKLVVTSRSNNNSRVSRASQHHNKVRGDMAGGDINKNRKA